MARTKDEKLRAVICKMYFDQKERKIDISRKLECSYSTVLNVIKEKENDENAKQQKMF